MVISFSKNLIFQSTPSVGRTTRNRYIRFFIKGISIHALRGEDDDCYLWLISSIRISIHALRGEDDTGPTNAQGYYKSISIHALRGEDDVFSCVLTSFADISIHALRGEDDFS